MKIDTQTLQVEITIAPLEGRKGGQRSNTSLSKMPDPPRVPRITRLMALAIKFEAMVEHREVRDYADIARLGDVTRARLTQIMNLSLLAPSIQEEILSLDRSDAKSEVSERSLRSLSKIDLWQEQERAWARMKAGTSAVQATAAGH